MGLCSPPCQPWSGAARQRGLHSPDGLSFTGTFKMGQCINATSITIENVAGFHSHPHYDRVIQFAQECGFALVHQGTAECLAVAPVNRNRWLAIFVRRDVEIDPHRVQQAAKLAICRPCMPLYKATLASEDVICKYLPKHAAAFLPESDAVHKLSDPRMLPSWAKKAIAVGKADSAVRARAIGPDQHMPSIMASYGGQHRLPPSLLCEKGLHTPLWFDQSLDFCRYFSPTELAACLAQLVLPCDHDEAWKILGNCITIPHAALQICRTHVILSHASPFAPDTELASIIELVCAKKIRASRAICVTQGCTYTIRDIDRQSQTACTCSRWAKIPGCRCSGEY